MSGSTEDFGSQGAPFYYLHEHANLFDIIRLVNIFARWKRSLHRRISFVQNY